VTPRFDPTKDAINREKHGLSLSFGDRILEDMNHLVLPSIREIDGEERFKVIGWWRRSCSPASSSGGPSSSLHLREKEQHR